MAQWTRRKRRLRDLVDRRTAPGAPPGTIMPDLAAPKPVVHVLGYGPDGYDEATIDDLGYIDAQLAKWPVTWVNVDGVGDADLIRALGNKFGLHPLALEDVTHAHQRAKVEQYGDVYFLVTRMPDARELWRTEQISFFFGEKFVLTFQQHPGGDCLESVRIRVRSGWGRKRAARPDALIYVLLDVIVDHYFPLIQDAGARLDQLETEVEDRCARGVPGRLHGVRRDLLSVRRVMWPMRDTLNAIMREPTPLIGDDTRLYLRDVHDHTVQIIDLVESFRDVAGGLTDIHLSTMSQRTNEIMRVLTIISTIFIPLTFVVGVYGMNFDRSASPWNMPELGWAWGYPLVWVVMIATAVVMLLAFWWNGWIGFGRPRGPRPHSDA